MVPSPGYPIVLTADRTLMANYRLLFDGMLAASQTTITPRPVMELLLAPGTPSDGLRARFAPLGLRRIEAALLQAGFTPDEVIVVDETHLAAVVGPATRVVAVSSGEPLGHGMSSSTMVGVAGGTIYPLAMFRRLLKKITRLRGAMPAAKVLLGGPGAWQVAASAAAMAELGIDQLVTGYAERNVAATVRALLEGTAIPGVITGEGLPAGAIPPIRGASTMGVVEISRGCGLGCGFCTIGREPMQHLPVETILADARTNLAAGMTSIAVLSEDFFRYGAQGVKVNPAALIGMLRRLRALDGLRLIQLDHANVISMAQYNDEELRTIYGLLAGNTGSQFVWVNVGVETASGALLKANGGAPKIGAHSVAAWGDLCAEQLRRLRRAGFFPLVSLVVGLPGEREEDVRRTLAWVESLREERLAIFPVLYAPISEETTASPVSALHWQLIRTCYRSNFRWVPHMYWDNQTAAGVPLWKRALLQGLGQGQALLFKSLFAWHARRAQ